VLVNRPVLLLTASYFCTNYVFYLFFNWFYYYMAQVREFPPQVSGWFTGLQWGIGVLAALAGAAICDELTRRRGVHIATRLTAMGGLFLSAALLVAGAAANHAVTAVLLLSCSFACIILVDTAYWVAAMVAGGSHAPAATGLMNTGGNVVGALGAVAVPLIAGAFGWFAAVASGALFAVLAAALWLLVQLPNAAAAPREPAAAAMT
jgi:MFS transporter, ACS family, glucarate transporter